MLIKNCLIFESCPDNEDRDPTSGRDIRTDGDTIIEVGANLSPLSGETVFDGQGLWLLPGFIDIHTHLRDLGQTAKEDVASGTLCAASGGYTTVVAMANTVPPIDNLSIFKEMLALIAERAVVKVLPMANVTRGMAGKELVEMALLSELGAVGFSDDGLPLTNLAVLRRALEQAKVLGSLIISHPEDKDLSGAGVMNESPYATIKGLAGVPTASESACIAREIEVVRLTGAPLHFAHVSAAASVKLIQRAKEDGLPVTADTTPHHLTLTDSELPGFNTNYKMNPPLRSRADQEALVAALKAGILDAVATDHAPHTEGEKERGFNEAPCGVIGLETAFALCLERLTDAANGANRLSRRAVLSKFTSEPARILGLPAPEIKNGAEASFSLFDPNCHWTYKARQAGSRSHNSPFENRVIKGRTMLTICAGKIAHQYEPAMNRWLAIEGLALK